MFGVALAAVAGVGFGLFQATNNRAGRHVDTFVATFGVLAVSVLVLGLITLATQDLGVVRTAPAAGYGWFAVAGGVHFFFGWTLLTMSQRRVGAPQTGVLTGTTPLFGTLIAFIVLDETLRAIALLGVALVVAGTVWLARSRPTPAAGAGPATTHTPWLGLAAALCWGTSPVFIRWGLESIPAPMIGVTVGMAAATAAYGVALLVRGAPSSGRLQRSTAGWVAVAGCIVALAIAAQWVALSLAPVAVVLALSQLAVPVVVLVAPLLSGGAAEGLTRAGMAAAGVIMAGSLIIIFSRGAAG